MTSPLDTLLSELSIGASQTALPPRLVRRADGTCEEAVRANSPEAFTVGDPDTLFGASPAYYTIKKEQPEHRLMLWLRLRGHKPAEIANLLKTTTATVRRVETQLWYQTAFTKLSSEIGKDAVENFLEGEVQNSCQTLVTLRDNAESEAVRLASAQAIIDRVKGKAVARTEVKSTGDMNVTVFDAAKLSEELARNAQALKSLGIGGKN